MAIRTFWLRYKEKEGRMKRQFFLHSVILMLLLFSTQLQAAKTTIKGFMPGAENLTVRLYSYDDYISNKEVLLAKSLIDSTGHFTITINVFEKQTISAFFRVMEFNSQEIYIPAGKTYEIKFTPFDYKDPNRIHIPLLSTILLRYSFTNVDSTDVNQLIGRFNTDYSSFLLSLSGIQAGMPSRSMMRPPKNKIDSFCTQITQRYQGYKNDFFQSYFSYTLANLKLNTSSSSRIKLYNTYLYRKPLLYDNIAYMEFFSNFFTDFIYSVSEKIPPYDIVKNVNIKPNVFGLLDSLGKDTLLRHEQLREAVLLLNIRDWFTSNTFKQDSLLKILDQYSKQTKFDIQSRIAQNLKFMLSRYRNGSKMPDFTFKSLDNSVFNNDSLTQKYTYLFFFSTWSHASVAEMLVLEQLKADWSDSIRFVAVSMDREPLKLYYFIQENKFSIPMYHFGNDYEMAERLSVIACPQAMLIGKKGEFIRYEAAMPSEGLVNTFNILCGKPIVKVQPGNVGH